MIELGTKLALVDLLGKPDRSLAVDQRECGVDLGVEPPDHLQHQELVEIRVEQRAHDRIELPGVVVDPPGDIGLRHNASLELARLPYADRRKKKSAKHRQTTMD